jgi:quercetin dioxygenase-like cupin family protein
VPLGTRLATSDGRGIVTLDEETTIELRTGDVASFPKGTRSTWTVVESVETFTVVSSKRSALLPKSRCPVLCIALWSDDSSY